MANILTLIIVAATALIMVQKINHIEADLRVNNTRIEAISKRGGKTYIDMFRVKEHLGMIEYTGEQLAVRRLVPPHPALYKWRPFGFRHAP